jgi:hypothetical protein
MLHGQWLSVRFKLLIQFTTPLLILLNYVDFLTFFTASLVLSAAVFMALLTLSAAVSTAPLALPAAVPIAWLASCLVASAVLCACLEFLGTLDAEIVRECCRWSRTFQNDKG